MSIKRKDKLSCPCCQGKLLQHHKNHKHFECKRCRVVFALKNKSFLKPTYLIISHEKGLTPDQRRDLIKVASKMQKENWPMVNNLLKRRAEKHNLSAQEEKDLENEKEAEDLSILSSFLSEIAKVNAQMEHALQEKIQDNGILNTRSHLVMKALVPIIKGLLVEIGLNGVTETIQTKIKAIIDTLGIASEFLNLPEERPARPLERGTISESGSGKGNIGKGGMHG